MALLNDNSDKLTQNLNFAMDKWLYSHKALDTIFHPYIFL